MAHTWQEASFHEDDDFENSALHLPKVHQSRIKSTCLVSTWQMQAVLLFTTSGTLSHPIALDGLGEHGYPPVTRVR